MRAVATPEYFATYAVDGNVLINEEVETEYSRCISLLDSESNNVVDMNSESMDLSCMTSSRYPFVGKVLLGKRHNKVEDLERFTAQRAALLLEVKNLDGLIAATRAYIRELDIRAGEVPADRRLRGGRSIRDMALQVMKEAGRPMQVSEIRAAIEATFGQSIERTSISPILSKMGQAGHIRHDDVGWSIAEK